MQPKYSFYSKQCFKPFNDCSQSLFHVTPFVSKEERTQMINKQTRGFKVRTQNWSPGFCPFLASFLKNLHTNRKSVSTGAVLSQGPLPTCWLGPEIIFNLTERSGGHSDLNPLSRANGQWQTPAGEQNCKGQGRIRWLDTRVSRSYLEKEKHAGNIEAKQWPSTFPKPPPCSAPSDSASS